MSLTISLISTIQALEMKEAKEARLKKEAEMATTREVLTSNLQPPTSNL